MVSMRQQPAMLDRSADARSLNPAYAGDQPGRVGRAAREVEQRRNILTSTVKLDVIPRLLLRQRPGTAPARAPDPAPAVAASEVAALVDLVLARDEPDAFGFLEAVHRHGASPEAILLELLAPAAQRLGVLWELDECDFTTVTIGLWRLQNAMTEFRPAFVGEPGVLPDAPRVLLVPVPGEQHGFGLAMVYEFFRRAGWNAWTGPVDTSAELAAMVRAQWIDVIGFTLACDDRYDGLAAEIRRVRRASCNPAIGVMVGGPAFTRSPHLAALVGADATAADGQQAVVQARILLDFCARRSGPVAR